MFRKHDVHLIAVCDGPDRLEHEFGESVCWQDMPDFIPRKTDMIRSWGIYLAWKTGRKFTLTLDDDVLPMRDVFERYEQTFRAGAPVSSYLDVGALTSFAGQMRGFPYADREHRPVAVQYGGWHGILDYDACTQLEGVNDHETFEPIVLPVPRGCAVTTCIMNAAWGTAYAPIMWQLPLLEGRFNRFGDIWSGLFQKRVLDALDLAMVVNGAACVLHQRASDPHANLEREEPGIPHNEVLWDEIDDWSRENVIECYRFVTDAAAYYFQRVDAAYAHHFVRARDEWLALF